VMRQSGTETLVTEEPYAFIAYVRVCGWAGRATTGSTRKSTAPRAARASSPSSVARRLTASLRPLRDQELYEFGNALMSQQSISYYNTV